VDSATVARGPAASVDAASVDAAGRAYGLLLIAGGRHPANAGSPVAGPDYNVADPSGDGRRQMPALPPLFSHRVSWPMTIVLSVDLHMS